MSTTTKNLGLTNPEAADTYDVGVQNANNELIDDAVGTLMAAVVGGGGADSLSGKIDATKAVCDEINTNTASSKATAETAAAKATQNGADIAAVKTTANGNAAKLDALKTTTDTIKTATDTLKTTTAGNNTKLDTANAAITAANAAIARLETDADSISGQVAIVENKVVAAWENAAGAKTAAESASGKLDTVLTMLGTMQTALDNANANIATLLTQRNGVKAIAAGDLSLTSNETSKAVDIPETMNPEKVVILASASSTYNVRFVRSGQTVTFYTTNSTKFSYQFIEFY